MEKGGLLEFLGRNTMLICDWFPLGTGPAADVAGKLVLCFHGCAFLPLLQQTLAT